MNNPYQPFNDQCSHHIETSLLICSANQLTGFYMMGILVVKVLTKYWNYNIFMQILCIVISDTQINLWMCFSCCLLAVILSELHEKPKRKDCVTERSTWKNLCEGYHFLSSVPSFLCHLLSFFSSTPSPYASDVIVEWRL